MDFVFSSNLKAQGSLIIKNIENYIEIENKKEREKYIEDFELVMLKVTFDTLLSWNQEKQIEHFTKLYSIGNTVYPDQFKDEGGIYPYIPVDPIGDLVAVYEYSKNRHELFPHFENMIREAPFELYKDDEVQIRVFEWGHYSGMKYIDIRLEKGGSVLTVSKFDAEDLGEKEGLSWSELDRSFYRCEKEYLSKDKYLFIIEEAKSLLNLASFFEVPRNIVPYPDVHSQTIRIRINGKYNKLVQLTLNKEDVRERDQFVIDFLEQINKTFGMKFHVVY